MTKDNEGGVRVERWVRAIKTPFTWLTDRIVKREYVELGVFGSYCTMAWEDAIVEVQNSDDPKEWDFRVVRMTRYQFRNLPEFQGW